MEKFIPLITRQFSMKVPVDDIFYIQRSDRKLKIVTCDNQYEVSAELQSMEKWLDKRFFYCLKHIIVNMEKIDRIQDQGIFLENGETIYLGQKNYSRAKQIYSAYLKQLM